MIRLLCSVFLLMMLTQCKPRESVKVLDEAVKSPAVPQKREAKAEVPKATTAGPVLCQTWFPKDASSEPPASLVACEKDADCGHGDVRACCAHFVVAVNSARRGCLAEATRESNCRARGRTPPPGFKRINQRDGFSTVCVQGACKLSLLGQTRALEMSPYP